jgi:hypothetical protein
MLAGMKRTLVDDGWVTLTIDPAIGLVCYQRTEKPYASLAELEAANARVAAALATMGPGMRLLLDVRRAPPRNDEAFEKHINHDVDGFTRRFAKTAMLVRTVVGKLQAKRLAGQRGVDPHVFDDEAAALAFLNG